MFLAILAKTLTNMDYNFNLLTDIQLESIVIIIYYHHHVAIGRRISAHDDR